MFHPVSLLLLFWLASNSWLDNRAEAGPIYVYGLVEKRSSPTVDDAVIAKAISFEPRSDMELEQFRVLTNLLKLLVDRRAKQLERISLISDEHAARVQNDLARLRRYSTSLEQVMQRFDNGQQPQPQQQQEQQSQDDGSVSRTVVNGINQPVWLLEQLRRVEQQRRRSRSDGQVD